MAFMLQTMFSYNIPLLSKTIVFYLTHWGRVTHICVGKLTIIGSDNGLSPGRRQAINWTNTGILLIGKCRLPNGVHLSRPQWVKSHWHVFEGAVANKSAWAQTVALCQIGDKPLHELMMTLFIHAYIYVHIYILYPTIMHTYICRHLPTYCQEFLYAMANHCIGTTPFL